MTAYKISAGQYDSILETTHSVYHSSIDDALATLRQVAGDDIATCEIDGGVLCYSSQEECDADNDGSSAFATIAERDTRDLADEVALIVGADGTDYLCVIVRQALADNAAVQASEIAKIVEQAREDWRREQAHEND
jgi:hypothetical protein